MNGVILFLLTISCFLMITSSFANSDDNYMQHKIEVNRASLKSKFSNLPHRIQAIGSRLKPGMYGWTSLMEASLTGDVKTVKSIIKQGVNLNNISDTNTALKLSTYYSHTDIVRILLKNGADPNIAGANKETALMIAASKGYIEIAKLLLNNNANAGSNEYIIRFKSKSKITSAIERAASSGHAEMVKLIISHLNNSTNINDALLSAASRGHDNIVGTLVEAGGNPNYYNKEHDIDALHLSIGNGHYNTASLLVALGADVNQTSRKNKISPLRYAVSLRRINITELLLNSGADIFNANIFDQSLIEIAEHNNDTSMATLLRAYKAPDNNPELIRFIKPGISILKELKLNTNKSKYLINTLGKPNNIITLEDDTSSRELDLIFKQVKWIYDGLYITLATGNWSSSNQEVRIIELTNRSLKLIEELKIGLNIRQFISTLGTPLQQTNSAIIYRMRLETSHDTYDDIVTIKNDSNGIVHTIIWELSTP